MAILKFNLAVNRRKKGETDFINCIAFSKVAELINQYFAKGNLIAIVGHIQTGSYENKEGKKIYTTDVIVDEWDFTGEKRESNENKADSYEPSTSGDGFYPVDEDSSENELPF